MKKTLMFVFAAALFCAATLNAQDQDKNNGILVHDAWVRMPAPSKTETALYMVIENHTAQKRALVSASSELAGKIEIHQMRMDGKVMIMMPIKELAIPARGKATLSENGYHMMMFRLTSRPAVGDNVKVTLTLDDGTSLPVTATVKK